MSLHEEPEISRFLERCVEATRATRHAACGVAQRSEEGWRFVGGCIRGTTLDQVFDLASITKSVTACLTAQLVSDEALCFDTPLEQILPLTRGTWAGTSTVQDLLSHRSGLPGHVQLFRKSWAHESTSYHSLLRQAAAAGRLEGKGRATYSDLGYLLVGKGLEHIENRPLDHLFWRKLFEPLGLRMGSARAFLASEEAVLARIAPTEVQRHRGGLLRGVVHDDNAWILAGTGCAGHAGLFAPLEGVLRFGAYVLDQLKGKSTRPMFEPLIRRRPGGTLRMGFDGVSGPHSLAGKKAGSETFGHWGFTGTGLWMDPERQRVAALLTNRVYPTRNNPSIGELRPAVFDFLWEFPRDIPRCDEPDSRGLVPD